MTFIISIFSSSAFFLKFSSKNLSYFKVSKSPSVLGGYFLGLPLPLFGSPSNNSGCLVFLWLFKAGCDKKDLPQEQKKFRPSCSCFDLRWRSILEKYLY
jgi:hypothetical protein